MTNPFRCKTCGGYEYYTNPNTGVKKRFKPQAGSLLKKCSNCVQNSVEPPKGYKAEDEDQTEKEKKTRKPRKKKIKTYRSINGTVSKRITTRLKRTSVKKPKRTSIKKEVTRCRVTS